LQEYLALIVCENTAACLGDLAEVCEIKLSCEWVLILDSDIDKKRKRVHS
jgi:hypothetical protein